MKISYCITAKNEHNELNTLLSFLQKNIRKQDEVIIQLDSDHTEEVLQICENNMKFFNEYHFCIFPLNNDFASFKNNLFKEATGDFIFQIDADEIPHPNLIEGLHVMLEHNPAVEVYLVPRINTVEGLSNRHIHVWGWNVNEKGWVNFPDYQYRIYKNTPTIRWKNKVHEVLEGHKQFTLLPQHEAFCLYHPKTIVRQELQNAFYSTL